MLLENLKEIKLSELLQKLNTNKNNKILLFCYDNNPETYIQYNVPATTNIIIYDFTRELHKVEWIKEVFEDEEADLCIIINLNNNQELLNTLSNIIKTNKVDDKPCNIKQWVLFTNDVNFISNCDNFLSITENYKLITEEVITNNTTANFNINDTTSTNNITSTNNTEPEFGADFENTTGHTEDLEELVDAYQIFSNENIVTEEVFQVRFENDEYRQGDNVDVNSIIKDFNTVDEMTSAMKSSVGNAQDDKSIVAQLQEERTSKNTIEAAVGIIGAVNDFGHYLTRGSRCPVCGKYVKYIPSNGYCSLKCAGKHLLTKVTSCINGEYELETPEIIDKIKNIMDYFNLAFNLISKMPDLLASVATLPEEYRNYATTKINLIFLEIKKIINLLLIKKNELIIKLLSKINYGSIDEKMQNLFATIQTILNTANALREQFEAAYSNALKSITKISALFYIGPQEYGFFTTLKSQMCMCPYYKTDAQTYPSDQLGRPFWGNGVINIAFDMSKCQMSFDIGAKSALKNTDMKKITRAIRKVFKPIQTPEYLMDPDLFDVRLALSDQNQGAIQKLMHSLQYTMVLGGDFIPEYDRLSLTNIWFIIAILTCWGPWTKSIFGDFIYHASI